MFGVTALFGRDLAVDLGTANTLVYVREHGIVLAEPSVVAVDDSTGALLAVGEEAKQMIGRTPDHVTAVRPLRDGVITDFDLTEKMLRYFLHRVTGRRPALLARPRVIVCVPSGVTAVEQRAVEDAAGRAGARAAYVIEEPMAAALGSGLRVHESTGSMIVDIGGGTTEVAVIAHGGIVSSNSVRVAGDAIDAAIVAHIEREHGLMLGERTAEELKLAIGSAHPLREPLEAEVNGRDLVSGLPRSAPVSGDDIRVAIDEPVRAIVAAVRTTIDRTPPELIADIAEHGMVVAGGGALLRGIDARLTADTGMPVRIADAPLQAVAVGSGKCLETFETLKRVLVSTARH